MYEIITVPNKILKTPTRPVVEVDDRIRKIAGEMIDTLKKQDNPKGVGLAANQVGFDISLFVFKHKEKFRCIINPKILRHSKKEVLDVHNNNTMLEGCLSIPFYYGVVRRFDKIRISFTGLDGKIVEEEFTMPEAVIIQHEIDHLEGRLFVERLLSQKGKLFKMDHTDKKKFIEVEI